MTGHPGGADDSAARDALAREIQEAFGPHATYVQLRFIHRHKEPSTLSMTVLTRDHTPLEPPDDADVFTLLERAETLFSEGTYPLPVAAPPSVHHRDRDTTFAKLKQIRTQKDEKR